ncbi:hypothetical protein [Chromobacterium sp. IIBBL 290-4]|uniref:hypothetical protein n=1 Tax=Chromobacterium sp. IIBBL 290-4 TaxID=2953890 RepID=UPI0020B6CE9F|nr:hypothetical protein [Chromobacterium sp. IIBBL 290-4]UTH74796.1 hypothetical protein NKT35_01430 [Chromobacterium sp. IIBBL 290-4]
MTRMSLLTLLFLSGAAAADPAQYSFGVGAGTTGFDLTGSWSILDNVNLRATLSDFNYNHNGNFGSGVQYQGKFKLFQAGLLADYFPFDSEFRFSAGLVLVNTKLNLNGNPDGTGSYTFNGNTYTSGQVGTATGQAKWDKPGLYLGLGYGNSLSEKGWSVGGDLGLIYTGKPTTTLSAACGSSLSAAQCQQLQSDVAADQATVQNDVNKYKIWPVGRISVNYGF